MSERAGGGRADEGADRRRGPGRRSTVTLLVLLLGLFFAFWYALSYYRASENHRAAAPAPTCSAGPVVTPGTTRVNVYNATERAGLAARTASALAKQGFVRGEVTNDPLGKTVTGSAEVRHGAKGLAQARLVAARVKGARLVRDDRTDDSVDLVLGTGFTTVRTPAPTTGGPTPCPSPS